MKRLLALALACCTATCGGDGGTSPVTPTGSAGSGTAEPVVTITITSENGAQSFSPNPASAAGQRVVFRNVDSVIHRVVLNDGSVDTGDIPTGGTSREVVMPLAGAHYHCSVHPSMIGAINSASGPPPACTGLYCDPTNNP